MFVIIAGSLTYYALRGPFEGTRSEPGVISTDDDPYLGPENASVTILQFSDFQCSACAPAASRIKSIVNLEYAGKVKLVFRDFPVYSAHRHAQIAAEAAQSAFEQGLFWEYHDLLFERQSEWGNNDLTGEEVETLMKDYAMELRINIEQFSKSVVDHKFREEVENDRLDGIKYGVRGPPTFIINGELITGFNESAIKNAINKALTSTSHPLETRPAPSQPLFGR